LLLLYLAVYYIIIIFYPRQSLFSAHTHTTHTLLFHRLLHLWVFTIYDTGCICQHWTVRAVYTSTCYLLLSTKVFMCNLTPPLPYHLLSSKNSHGLSKLALAVFYGGYATAENPVKHAPQISEVQFWCHTKFLALPYFSWYEIPLLLLTLNRTPSRP